jgi:cell wall-associated NlpC family hydrolase
MSNQLLFGERMVVLHKKKNWWQVQSTHDNYEGWIRNNLITLIEDASVVYNGELITAELFNVITIEGIKTNVSMGCNLPGLTKEEGRIGKSKYNYRGQFIKRSDANPGEEIVRKLTLQWLNAPYLWGGRTPLGVDCSGFVQVIFKMIGLDLLRDAKQQARQGMKVKKLSEAKPGDLAFFEKKEKITHVGILLSHDQIIHASGKVRIDAIDEKGIINADTRKRTHSLAAIRRYW